MVEGTPTVNEGSTGREVGAEGLEAQVTITEMRSYCKSHTDAGLPCKATGNLTTSYPKQ